MAGRGGIPGFALLVAAGGAWAVYAGVHDVPLVDGLRDVLKGRQPAGRERPGSTLPWRTWEQVGASVVEGVGDLVGGVASTTPGTWDYLLDRTLARRLGQLRDSTGIGLPARGGYRTRQQQAALRVTNGCPDVDKSPASSCRVPTARPGTGKHERIPVEAFDIDVGAQGAKLNLLYGTPGPNSRQHLGMHRPVAREPWHFELVPGPLGWL